VALREHGLYMICNVKMCHKYLPLQWQLHHPHPQGQGGAEGWQGDGVVGLWLEGHQQNSGHLPCFLLSHCPRCSQEEEAIPAAGIWGYQRPRGGSVARPTVGSEYQSNMGQVDGWNYSKYQFKVPATNSPTFRIFSDFGIMGCQSMCGRPCSTLSQSYGSRQDCQC
jgi:hypothetical protein